MALELVGVGFSNRSCGSSARSSVRVQVGEVAERTSRVRPSSSSAGVRVRSSAATTSSGTAEEWCAACRALVARRTRSSSVCWNARNEGAPPSVGTAAVASFSKRLCILLDRLGRVVGGRRWAEGRGSKAWESTGFECMHRYPASSLTLFSLTRAHVACRRERFQVR